MSIVSSCVLCRWAGHAARIRKMRNAYKILIGRQEGSRRLGRPGRRRKDFIKIDLREVGFEGVDCIHMAQDRNNGGLM
jgi:hypothetical protein